jgi:hypothetical protein
LRDAPSTNRPLNTPNEVSRQMDFSSFNSTIVPRNGSPSQSPKNGLSLPSDLSNCTVDPTKPQQGGDTEFRQSEIVSPWPCLHCGSHRAYHVPRKPNKNGNFTNAGALRCAEPDCGRGHRFIGPDQALALGLNGDGGTL